MKISLSLFKTLPLIEGNKVTIIIKDMLLPLSIAKNVTIENNFDSNKYAILVDSYYTPCIVYSDYDTNADAIDYRLFKTGNAVSSCCVINDDKFRTILNKRHKINSTSNNFRARRVIQIFNNLLTMITNSEILIKRLVILDAGSTLKTDNDTYIILEIKGDDVSFINTRTKEVSIFSLNLIINKQSSVI